MRKKISWSFLIGIVATVLVMIPGDGFVFTLFRSGAVQIMLVLLILSIVFLTRWRVAYSSIMLLCCLCVNSLLPPFFSKPETEAVSEFNIAHFNVLMSNKGYSLTIDKALETKADLLSFQEVDEDWAKNLTCGLGSEYPYYEVIATEECCWGIAVFSKHPFRELKRLDLANVPNLTGKICVSDKEISFITSHTSSPITYAKLDHRNEHIEQLAQYIDTLEEPVLAIGDYNSVPWDPAILNFKEQTRLADSRKSLTPTWPAFFTPLSVPIDFIFHSDELMCTNFVSIKGTSSDHYGVVGSYIFTTKL